MTADDISRLAEIISDRDAGGDTKKQINRIFRNRKAGTVIRDAAALMPQLEKPMKSKALLVVVLCLLHRSAGFVDEVQKALEEEGLISGLFGGLMVLLGGKSRTMCLKVSLTDGEFPNRYEFLGRFWGEFGYWEYLEVIHAAEIIAKSDMKKFEELAFRDATHLILLNMTTGQLRVEASGRLIKRLLEEGDELQANIGFYFAVRHIARDMRDCDELERNEGMPDRRSKRRLHRDLRVHLETFYGYYDCCTAKRKASLLVNYILFERNWPDEFGRLLMGGELREAFIEQIMSSGKVETVDDVIKMVRLIHRYPCKGTDGTVRKKDELYAAVVGILKHFIVEERGFYLWDERDEQKFRGLCVMLPKKYLRQYQKFLEKIMGGLMVSELDEMVRHSIYLKDKKRWDICRGMINVMEETAAR